jgi:glycine cleavage system H protein
MSEQRFTDTHEWVTLDGRVATIGISRHAVGQLGDIVFFELPAVGDHFNAQSIFGVVESVKAASDLYMPVSGEVVAINEAVRVNPGLVNDDSEKNGWLLQVRMDDPSVFFTLLSSGDYTALVNEVP